MRKTKKSTTLAITDIGKLIRISGTVKPIYKYEPSDDDKGLFDLKGKTFRVLETTPIEPIWCFVLKHKVIHLGEYKQGSYETHGMGDGYYTVQPYLKVTDTVMVYLCTKSIACNTPTFFVHPNNIIKVEDDNKQTTKPS